MPNSLISLKSRTIYTVHFSHPLLKIEIQNLSAKTHSKNERAPKTRARESEIQGLLVEEAPEGTFPNHNLYVSNSNSNSDSLFLLLQVTKKNLNAVFTSVSDESSKDELSSISEISESNHAGDITDVRFNFQSNPNFKLCVHFYVIFV